jgi:hypothetical protein
LVILCLLALGWRGRTALGPWLIRRWRGSFGLYFGGLSRSD